MMSAIDNDNSDVTDTEIPHDTKTAYVWPPGDASRTTELGSMDFMLLAQQFWCQISSLKTSLMEQQRETERCKQERASLRMYAGLPDAGYLPGKVAQSIVTCLSNATIHDMANGDFARPSLLQRIGIQAKIKENIDIAALKMCKEDYLALVQENNQLRCEVAATQSKVKTTGERNDILCGNLHMVRQNLQTATEELKACLAEKGETQASCRSHLVHHENKLKEKDQEVQKARKLITELRKTTDQQFNEIKKHNQAAKQAEDKSNNVSKTLADVKKQVEKCTRDIENKNNAIKLLQRLLRANLEKKTAIQETTTMERKRSMKKINELETELDESKKSAQRLFLDIARKDRELKQKTTRLDKAHAQLLEVSALLERVTLELSTRDTALEKLRQVESELRANLCQQTAQLQTMTERTPTAQKKEASSEIVLEQLRFVLEKVLKGDHSHLVKSWQSEWQRNCRSIAKLSKLHETIGKTHFPGVSFSDPSRLNVLLKPRSASSPVLPVTPRSTETQGQISRTTSTRQVTNAKSRGVNADCLTVSASVKRVRRSTAVHNVTNQRANKPE